MIITISGHPGAGKSTLARNLAQKLNYKKYSMGDLRGKIAVEKGITIDELKKIAEKDPSSHYEVDEYQKKLGETEDNFICDGWISWYFIPHSFKIFLKVDAMEAGKRVFLEQQQKKDTKKDEKVYQSVDETRRVLRERFKVTNDQYKQYYNVDINDERKYDFVIDTTRMTPEEVL